MVASLLKRNIKSRLLLRDLEKATKLFGKQDEDSLQVRMLFSTFRILLASFLDLITSLKLKTLCKGRQRGY